jgi:putative transposase
MESLRFLPRDRDDKYSEAFNAVFEAEDMDVIKSAPRAPRMNAHCERIIGSIRREALDHVLIMGEAHARQVLAANSGTTTSIVPIGPVTSYRPMPISSPPPCTTWKAADSYAPASSAVSSTSTGTWT